MEEEAGEGQREALSAALDPAVVTVSTGNGASCEVRVHNGADVSTEVALEILGQPGDWAWANPQHLTLAPGADSVARVVLRPPRTAHVAPGPTPFTVRLVPAGDHAEAVTVDGVVEVAGFTDVTARLVPPVAEARRRSTHEVVLENQGSLAARVVVEALVGDGGPEVTVHPPATDLAPRERQRTTVAVRARSPLLGWRARRHRFQLSVTTATEDGSPPSPVILDGALRQQPNRALAPVVVVALLLGVGGGLAAVGGDEADIRSGDTVAPATAPPDLPVPRYAVGSRTETFVDPTRPTRAYASFPARPDRTLETLVFYPAAGPPGGEATEGSAPAAAEGPFPLIVFAHGSGGLGDRYFGLLRTWAAAGYVVAAPVFPFASVPDQASPDDYPNQPGDMSVVADELLARNADADHELAGLIDPEHLGAAGHSLGGMTTLGLVANTCCHDPRFDAGIVLAGRQVPFPGGDFWVRINTPVLFVHGDADTSVVYADGRAAFLEAPPPKHLVTMEGGDHGEPYQGPPDLPAMRVTMATTLAFFDHHLRGAEDGLERLRAAGDVAGTSRVDHES